MFEYEKENNLYENILQLLNTWGNIATALRFIWKQSPAHWILFWQCWTALINLKIVRPKIAHDMSLHIVDGIVTKDYYITNSENWKFKVSAPAWKWSKCSQLKQGTDEWGSAHRKRLQTKPLQYWTHTTWTTWMLDKHWVFDSFGELNCIIF